MPKEFLDGVDFIASFKQMRVKGMSEGVTNDMLYNARITDCFLDAPLHFASTYNSVLHGFTKFPRRWGSLCPLQSVEYAPAIEGVFQLPLKHVGFDVFILSTVC